MPIINLVYEAPREWKPWSNTIWYRPLNWDFNDYSGNNRNLTNSWVTFVSWLPWQVASFASWNNAYYQDNSLFDYTSPFTYNVWVNADYIPNWYYNSVHPYYSIVIWWQNWWNNKEHQSDLWLTLWSKVIWFYGGWTDYMNWWSINTWIWYNLCFTFDWTNKALYVNWVNVANETVSLYNPNYTNARITLSKSGTWYQTSPYQWKMSNVIIENKIWNAQEISKYYNWTKWNYGL